MSRKTTGTVRVLRNEDGERAWHGKWTHDDGTRSEWLPLPGKIDLKDKAAAKACAVRLAPRMRVAGSGGGIVETVRTWFGRLHQAKEAKGLSTVKDMRGRATRWVFPIFGDKKVRDLTREDGEKLVASLDVAVAAFLKDGPGKEGFPPRRRPTCGAKCHTRSTKR
jgi:hypothetical protein